MSLVVEKYGVIDYQRAYERQLALVEQMRQKKDSDDICMLLEHDPVFTLGRNGSSGNISVSKKFLEERHIELVRIERGGEITYHGPGQLVCYPLINLHRHGFTVGEFIFKLEQIMLDVVHGFGITAVRDPRNHGIWSGGAKLGSVGIAIRHGISYHGLALNVNLDMEPFSWINPCGLSNISMTSMERESRKEITIEAVRDKMVSVITSVLGCQDTVVNVTSQNDTRVSTNTAKRRAKPKWLRQRLPAGADYEKTRRLVSGCNLHTVCQEARCPNQFECFSKGTATFMIMGANCTRNCGFCAVSHEGVQLLDEAEPSRIAQAVLEMNLEYVVVTSVTRDDLPDGGAAHFAATIQEIAAACPGIPVEVLIPDFQGDKEALKTVCAARPAVLNHNVETVSRLYPLVRPQAVYQRSLELLTEVKQIDSSITTKSGIMAGLGESDDELRQTMKDIRDTGCDLLTIGQYLQPTTAHLPVKEFYSPELFSRLKTAALEIGFSGVASGPHVRSSYRADYLYRLTRS